MKIQGDVAFKAKREQVWEVLMDPGIIQQCIPGCQELKEIETDTYEAILKIGIGAVSGSYAGKLQLSGKKPPSQYSMVFEGSGKQGFVRGSGEARLRENGKFTALSYDCDVEVGGLIASVGQRVLEGVGKFLVGQMFTKLQGFVGEETIHETSSV